MVIFSPNKILINKSEDDLDSTLEPPTTTVCPLCKKDNALITDPKSAEIICRYADRIPACYFIRVYDHGCTFRKLCASVHDHVLTSGCAHRRALFPLYFS